MPRYLLSPAARADLGAIWDYTAERWGEAQAERYPSELRDTCLALAEGRRRGRDAGAIRAGYRKLTVGSHMLYFRGTPTGDIEIVRVLHQSMDADRHV